MTTKKQRRANVAAKRAEYDAESRRLGLAAQARSHDKTESIRYQQERFGKLEEKISGKSSPKKPRRNFPVETRQKADSNG